jgi:hypothetical protein
MKRFNAESESAVRPSGPPDCLLVHATGDCLRGSMGSFACAAISRPRSVSDRKRAARASDRSPWGDGVSDVLDLGFQLANTPAVIDRTALRQHGIALREARAERTKDDLSPPPSCMGLLIRQKLWPATVRLTRRELSTHGVSVLVSRELQ